MERLSENDLKSAFKDAINNASDSALESLLQDISAAMRDIQQIGTGIDVSLDLGRCCERHFSLFPSVKVSLSAGGMLTVGNQDHLIAIATLKDGNPALLIGLSQLNMRHESIYATNTLSRIKPDIRSVIIDCQEENGIQALQTFILKQAGLQAVIARNDTSHSFKNQPQLFRK